MTAEEILTRFEGTAEHAWVMLEAEGFDQHEIEEALTKWLDHDA